jgi:phage-related protein
VALNIGNLVGFIGLDSKGFDDALDKAGEKLKSGNGGKFKAAAVAIGVAIGVALGASIVGAMDVQGSQAKLAAQLGLTQQEAAHYGKVAGDVYAANWGDSIDSVNDAIVAITRNIGEGNDAWLKDTTTTVLAMQETFGAGADEISRTVAQMLNTGMAANATQALDIITKGFQDGDDRAGDLLDTFTEYSTQFRKLGLDGQTAMGLISQGLQGGARDADLVADALKEFSIRAVDGSTLTASGFASLGLSAQTMAERIGKGGDSAAGALDETLDKLRAIPDPVARAQAATALFGTQAEDLGTALFDLDASNAVQQLGDVTGAAKNMADTVGNTASGNIASFKRQLQVTFTTVVGGAVIPMLTSVTGWFSAHLGPAIDKVTGFLHDHADTARQVGAVLGVVAGAIAAVVVVTKAWAIAQGIMNAVLTANPVGIVVVALAGLVAVIVLAYKKVEWFRDLLNGVWAVLQTGWAVAAGIFSSIWHSVVEPVWAAFSAAARDLWVNVLQPAFAWIGAKWDELSAKLQLLWVSRIQPALTAFGGAVQELWANYGQKLVDWWNEHWPAIAAVLQAAWTNVIQPALAALFSMLGAVVDYVQQHWPEISTVIQTAASEVGSAFSALGTVISTVWSVVSGVWSAMQVTWSAVSGAVSGAANAVSSAFSGIGSAATTSWNTLKSAWSAASSWFTGLKDTVVGALSSAGTWLLDIGKNIITGLITGIRNAAGSLASQVVSIVKNAIPGPIAKFLGINSPSRYMAKEIGQWIPKGIAMGIDQHSDVVAASMRNLVDVPTVTIPAPVAAGGYARGGDGAAAGQVGTGGTYIAKQVHQKIDITAGWEARETDSFISMQLGPDA